MPDPETVVAAGAAASQSAPVAAVPASAAMSAPETAPADPEYPKTAAIVDLWFAQCVQGTEVGRYTDAYNAMHAAKEELKRRLAKEI